MHHDAFAEFVAQRYRDYAPRAVRMGDGALAFLIEGMPLSFQSVGLYSGLSPEQYDPMNLTWDEPGTKGPVERLKEQDLDGVDAEVIFPGLAGRRNWGGITDDDAYHAVVRGYNRYLAEAYAPVDPDRLITLGVMPERTLEGALAELEYCANAGLKGINVGKFPSGKSYPSPEDDRFWAAALEMDMPVTIHVALLQDRAQPVLKHPRQPDTLRRPPDPTERLFRYGLRGAANAIQMILSGVFDRFPALRIYFAENQIGWVPLFMEQADHNYERHHFWAERAFGWPKLGRLPSEYLREHCYWGFFNDQFGVRVRHEIGVDRIMWGSDFPHVESDWPRSAQLLAQHFADVPAEESYRLTAGNALEFFRLHTWAEHGSAPVAPSMSAAGD